MELGAQLGRLAGTNLVSCAHSMLNNAIHKVENVMLKGCRVELDDDLPGGGQHFCMSCSKYFVSDSALQQHARTKPHKRRLGELLSLRHAGKKPHNQIDAEVAAGMGAPDNGRPLRSHAGAIAMEQ